MKKELGFPVKMELHGEPVYVKNREDLNVLMIKKHQIRPNNFPYGDKRLGTYC